MLVLCLDTCTERGVVALYNGLTPLYVDFLPFGLQNSSSLMPSVAKGLSQIGAQPHQLNLIAVAAGPGSYTGIRVGVAAAKAMAFAHHTPLVGISTLHGFIPPNDGLYAAVIDAKIGGAYYLMGQRKGDFIVYMGKPSLLTLDKFAEELQQVQTFVTPVSGQLQQRLGESSSKWNWIETDPDPTQMVQVALQSYQDGNFSREADVDILYLRKTQAEIERESMP